MATGNARIVDSMIGDAEQYQKNGDSNLAGLTLARAYVQADGHDGIKKRIALTAYNMGLVDEFTEGLEVL